MVKPVRRQINPGRAAAFEAINKALEGNFTIEVSLAALIDTIAYALCVSCATVERADECIDEINPNLKKAVRLIWADLHESRQMLQDGTTAGSA